MTFYPPTVNTIEVLITITRSLSDHVDNLRPSNFIWSRPCPTTQELSLLRCGLIGLQIG